MHARTTLHDQYTRFNRRNESWGLMVQARRTAAVRAGTLKVPVTPSNEELRTEGSLDVSCDAMPRRSLSTWLDLFLFEHTRLNVPNGRIRASHLNGMQNQRTANELCQR
jgi:hypothetical protein